MRLIPLLLVSLLLAGCGGITIDLEQPAEPNPQPQPEPKQETPEVEVLAFSAKWCAACRRDKPQIEEMRRQGVKVTVIDADENPELIKKHRVKKLPTYIVLEDGVEIERTGDIILIVTIIAKVLKILVPIVLPLIL
jgi:thiol-disulfide isomerase/thioredoxin